MDHRRRYGGLDEIPLSYQVQHISNDGPIENIVLFRPLLNHRVGNEDLSVVTGFGESLLCRNAITELVIEPKGELCRFIKQLGRSGPDDYMGL